MPLTFPRGRSPVTRRALVIVVLVGAFWISFHVAERASAYDQEGHVFCKYSYSGSGLVYIVLRDDPDFPPSGFTGIPQVYSAAQTGWNISPAPVWLTHTSSGEAWIGAYFMGSDGPYAHTNDYCTWPSQNRYGSDTYLNMSRYLSTTERESVASHELGHVVAIRHSYESPAVMNVSRNRSGTYGPQSDDVCGVKARYGLSC